VDGVANNFSVKSGAFIFENWPRPACSDGSIIHYDNLSYATLHLDTEEPPNVSVWEGFDISTLFRQYTVQVQLVEVFDGEKRGGVVINYRPHRTVSNHYVFYFVALEEGRLSLYRYNGDRFNLMAFSPATVDWDTWYEITVQTWVSENHEVMLSATGSDGSLGPILLTEFMPDTGNCGVGSYGGKARFAKFQVDLYGV
jgi:hypothetical protein